MDKFDELDVLNSSVLVLCPHPDDFDVAAVTLKYFHDRGAAIKVVVSPTYSGILESFYDRPVTHEEMIETRELEQLSSILRFGLEKEDVQFLPHQVDLDENGEWCYTEENRVVIWEALEKAAPDYVFIPHPNDPNPAHRAMGRMVREYLDLHQVTLKLLMQMDPKTELISADYYTPFSQEDADWKAELLMCHRTQNHRNLELRGITLAERILEVNRRAAIDHGLESAYAEAFEIEKKRDGTGV